MVNWALLATPTNWVVVILIIVLGVVATTLVHQYLVEGKA